MLQPPCRFRGFVDEARDEDLLALGVGGSVKGLGDETGLGVEDGLELAVVSAGKGDARGGDLELEDDEEHV